MLSIHCINSFFTVFWNVDNYISILYFVNDRELRIVQVGDVLQRIRFGIIAKAAILINTFQISRSKIDSSLWLH
jgi:hypothetical protein